MKTQFPEQFKKGIILLLWLVLWQLLSLGIHNRILLAGPAETLRALGRFMMTFSFWKTIFFSFWKISLGFLLAFFAGLLTGALSYKRPFLGDLLQPLLQFMKAVPVACFVILALLWTGSKNLSILISFLVAYPMLHISTLEGLLHADRQLLEMAQVFRLSRTARIFYLYRIFLCPYLISSCKSALGMAIKAGIAAEVIGTPAGSVGEALYQAKIYLETGELFAWTVAIIIVSTLFEKMVLLLLQKGFGKEHLS